MRAIFRNDKRNADSGYVRYALGGSYPIIKHYLENGEWFYDAVNDDGHVEASYADRWDVVEEDTSGWDVP